FDDGVGFRYEFPRQDPLKYFVVSEELTEFALTGDHTAFWIPGDYDTNEYQYTTSPLSKIDATTGKAADEIYAKTAIGRNAVQTPLMMKTGDGLYINIHEAALVDYPAMNLIVNQQTFGLSTHLVPDAAGNKAYLQTPAKTPWRTIVVSDKAADVLTSKLILNLNEPSKISDVSWIKPQKYVGIWWELHVGAASWNYADIDNLRLTETDWKSLTPNGRHGATTSRVKRYIDFAATHGFSSVLVEGWNIGWEDWFGKWKEEVFDFVTPYPDFDVAGLQKYAEQRGVKLLMHHETSSSVTNYERRMDEAYRFMKTHGYDAVKTGYVGKIIPRGEHHDGQWMINHYVRVAERTAQNKIMVNMHEPVRPTGLHRTYPNWLACEAARGNEFNAWSHGNPPEHETILPFTRLMGGPMDYTPGIFQIKMNHYRPDRTEQVHSTLAKQLALYVTLYSPLQMAA
ncbi:MAG: glycoside hydrolase family 97 catalytic domain-containing protein, partial [Bacteroidota bacterium]